MSGSDGPLARNRRTGYVEAAYQQEQVEKETEMGCKVKNEGRRTIITKTRGCSSECPPVLFGESGKIISCFLERHYDILSLS